MLGALGSSGIGSEEVGNRFWVRAALVGNRFGGVLFTHLSKEVMPTSAQTLRFILTYVWESFLAPTITTARPGTCTPYG